MTIEEWIKSLSTEEFANYMTNFVLNSIALISNRQNIHISCDVMDTYKTILEWLKQEHKEDE